jgi:hypothetical protein
MVQLDPVFPPNHRGMGIGRSNSSRTNKEKTRARRGRRRLIIIGSPIILVLSAATTSLLLPRSAGHLEKAIRSAGFPSLKGRGKKDCQSPLCQDRKQDDVWQREPEELQLGTEEQEEAQVGLGRQ